MRNLQDPTLSHFHKHALTHLISQVDEENPPVHLKAGNSSLLALGYHVATFL